MKKILILFVMSLSLVACGSSDDGDDGNGGSGGGGGGGVVTKPNSITAEPNTMVAGTPTQITFVFDPPESVSTCTGFGLSGSCSTNSMPTITSITLTNTTAGTCIFKHICGGETIETEITITEP